MEAASFELQLGVGEERGWRVLLWDGVLEGAIVKLWVEEEVRLEVQEEGGMLGGAQGLEVCKN